MVVYKLWWRCSQGSGILINLCLIRTTKSPIGLERLLSSPILIIPLGLLGSLISLYFQLAGLMAAVCPRGMLLHVPFLYVPRQILILYSSSETHLCQITSTYMEYYISLTSQVTIPGQVTLHGNPPPFPSHLQRAVVIRYSQTYDSPVPGQYFPVSSPVDGEPDSCPVTVPCLSFCFSITYQVSSVIYNQTKYIILRSRLC